MLQKIHLKAPSNWINDPNGFIYYKGKYHLFYQHFPYGPRWGTMHWGHAVSEDLTEWEHKGIALFPSKYADKNGCFSGSALEHEDKLYLYYTGVRYEVVNPEDIHLCVNDQFEASQLMIVSEDGETFDNYHMKNVVIPPIADEKVGDRTHTRDPKVWRGKDAWYMVLGSRTEQENGKLLFYKSEDLREWKLSGGTTMENNPGRMWECPDFFETECGKVLIFSPMGITDGKALYGEQTICMTVDFDEENCEMKLPKEYQYFDYGLDLYAPQSTTDEEGRRVIVAWARMPEPVDGKWSGMFCMPRVVEVKDGHIYFRLHPNLKQKFCKKEQELTEAKSGVYCVSADMKEGEVIDIRGYKIFYREGRIHTDRSKVFLENQEEHSTHFVSPELRDGSHVDVYVDNNLIEVYINDGEYVITNVVYDLKEKQSAVFLRETERELREQ